MSGNRQSLRLQNFDYTQRGAYHVTICVERNERALGTILDGRTLLTDAGRIVYDSWKWLEQQYEYVELDEFVVMPNHFHGIICIKKSRYVNDSDSPRKGGSRAAPTANVFKQTDPVTEGGSRAAPTANCLMKPKPLGSLVGAFKTVSTRQININRNTPGARFWQRNYYEHIIRGECDLATTREYIANNPLNWATDEYFRVSHV